jgi:CRISPR/Cas system-associated endoribonuclease Cas2
METTSERYLRYLQNSTEESRLYDESFHDLEHQLSAEIEQRNFDEIRSIFVSDAEWYADEISRLIDEDEQEQD